MKNTVIIFFANFVIISALTCNEILEAPEEKTWSFVELQTVAPKDIVSCLVHISKEKMQMQEAEYIWKVIVKFFGGVGNIPERILMQLHWVTVAVTPEDMYNITFNSVDIIQNFGLDFQLTYQQLDVIADRVREDWGGKEPEDYSHYDLIALGQILCAFNRSEIERIHPEAYKEAASVLGKLNNCNPEVLKGLATLAIQNNAFGSPTNWDENLSDIIGVVAEHVPGEKHGKHKRHEDDIMITFPDLI